MKWSTLLMTIQKCQCRLAHTIKYKQHTFRVRTFGSINTENVCCWHRVVALVDSKPMLQTNPCGYPPTKLQGVTTQNTNTNIANEMSLKELLLCGPDNWETGRRGQQNDERTALSTGTLNTTYSTSVRLKSIRKSVHPLVPDDTVKGCLKGSKLD
jgi:hypothetical protein